MKLLFFKIKKFITSFPDSLKKTQVKAVYDADLKNLVKSLGLDIGIENGKYKCKYCGTIISLENLQVILKENSKIKFICSNLECLSKLS